MYTVEQGSRVSYLATPVSLLLVKGCSSPMGLLMMKPNKFPDWPRKGSL